MLKFTPFKISLLLLTSFALIFVPLANSSSLTEFSGSHQMHLTTEFSSNVYDDYVSSGIISRKDAIEMLVAYESSKVGHISPLIPQVSLFRQNTEQGDGTYMENWLYKVSFTIETPSFQTIHAHINAVTGAIIKTWNNPKISLKKMSGFGGNTTSGLITFGENLEHLVVERRNDGKCYFETEDIKTRDLQNSRGKINGKPIKTAFNFPCEISDSFIPNKQVNGSYSPLNEAHFYGVKTVEMFTEWFNEVPHKDQIVINTHYAHQYENAMWNGNKAAIFFGDGKSRFHALTDMNLIAHEIAHGFTEQQSNLAYKGMSGAINESFSDMTGEALEYFIHGEVDWTVAKNISKNSIGIRFFDNPERDGNSISYFGNFDGTQSIHEANGIFNHAFYLLATSSGWDIKMAYSTFYYANKYHWQPNSTFDEAACGVYTVARDLGLPLEDVVLAFDSVGVNTCSSIHVVTEDLPVFLETKKKVANHIIFKLDGYAEKVILSIVNGGKHIDLRVAEAVWPSEYQNECVNTFTEERLVCDLNAQKSGQFNVLLTTEDDMSGIEVSLKIIRSDISQVSINEARQTTMNMQLQADRHLAENVLNHHIQSFETAPLPSGAGAVTFAYLLTLYMLVLFLYKLKARVHF